MTTLLIPRWLEENGDYQQEEEKYCKVYDKNDFFTLFVQLLLAAMALFSLYFKRMGEVPRRTFRTWFLDISKQAFGACYAHILNMVRIDKIDDRGLYTFQCLLACASLCLLLLIPHLSNAIILLDYCGNH